MYTTDRVVPKVRYRVVSAVSEGIYTTDKAVPKVRASRIKFRSWQVGKIPKSKKLYTNPKYTTIP